jgi:acetylornithine deacetylase
MPLSIDKKYLFDTLSDLVEIDSVNPDLVPGGAGEVNIAKHIAGLLTELGMKATLQELKPGRMNVIGWLKGTGGGKSLLLSGHMDVVGIGEMVDPFKPQIKDGKMYGRGTFDMKGGLAAALGAIKALRDGGIHLRGDLVFAGVADEEYASIGTEGFIKDYHVDAAIVNEPTGLNICNVHKGFIWYEIVVSGKAAHGSDYIGGVDAILHMGRFLAELEKLVKRQQNRTPHPVLGPPSLHASLITGGQELSTYPAESRLQIEWRTLPGQKESELRAELQAIIDHLSAQDPAFSARIEPVLLERQPFEISPDKPLVQCVLRNAKSVLGESPELFGESGWTDCSLFDQAGIETLLFGPSGDGAHSKIEWLDLQSVEDTALILAKIAEDFCNLDYNKD